MSISDNSPSRIRARKETTHHRKLLGKVVLLKGNDAAVLQSLVSQLALKGADVVLLYWQMPVETVRRIKESAQSIGRHLLLIEQVDKKAIASRQLIETIQTELGRLDIFIDLSAEKDVSAPKSTGQSNGANLPGWPITQAQFVLKELVRSS